MPMLPRRRVPRFGVAVASGVLASVFLVALIVAFEQVGSRAQQAAALEASCPAPGPPRSVRREGPGAGPPTTVGVQASVCSRELVRNVPESFLGISTEYWALPLFEHHSVQLARVLSLLKVPGGGPLILRVGGASADQTFWDPSAKFVPRWAFALTPIWFRQTRRLISRVGARLILDLNFITGTPAVAAHLAVAAQQQLPHGSIAAFEVGNEPDLYDRAYWLKTLKRQGLAPGNIPAAVSPGSYVAAFQQYARVLARVAPGVALAGPAVAHPGIEVGWISTLLRAPHPGLGIVSGHMYPYSACARPSSASYPTIARLLSETATEGLVRRVRAAVRLARRAGLPFRLTELNSVTCGGLRHVSNSFATALWAPDALFELLRAGVDGVNVHVREDAVNGAFALRQRGLIARPLLYGLLLFARTLGPDAELVRVRVRAPASLHLKVWAVRLGGDVLHVLLIDKGDESATVHLALTATDSATVQRLLAPSVSARSDVTLDGQHLSLAERWQGVPATEKVRPGAAGYEVAVPPFSAALLSVRLDP